MTDRSTTIGVRERPAGERTPGESAGADSRRADPGTHLPDIDAPPPAAPGDQAGSAATVSVRTKILAMAILVAVLGGSLFFLVSLFRKSGDAARDGERPGATTETVTTASATRMSPAGPTPGIPLPMAAGGPVFLPPAKVTPQPKSGAEASSAAAAGAGQAETAPQSKDRPPSAGEDSAATAATAGEDESAAPPARNSQALADALMELSAMRAVLEARIGGLEEAVRALVSRVDELDRAVARREAADGLEKRVGAMEAGLRRLERRSLENRRMLRGDAGARRRGRTLPFRLEAIDWWGGTPSVAVSAGGKRRFLSPGESLSGWTLVSVDAATGVARFSRDGRQALLETGR